MPRQRPLSLPAGFSVAASPPRVCANSGLAYRQTIHSELQAPVSSTIYSNEQRSSRSSFSLLLKDARDSEESRASRHSTEATAETLSPSLTACESESESESAYSCGPGQSLPSMADSSDWELDPQDSISNRGPSPSENGRNWLFQHPPGWCNIHSCYMSGEFFDPKYRAWIQVIGPRVRTICATNCPSSSSTDFLSIRDMKRVIVISQTQGICSLSTPRRGALTKVVVIGTGALITIDTMMTSRSPSPHGAIVLMAAGEALLMLTGTRGVILAT